MKKGEQGRKRRVAYMLAVMLLISSSFGVSYAGTDLPVEKQSEAQSELQKQENAKKEKENEPAQETESETQSEPQKETESEKQSESQKETGSEKQSESQKETESEKQSESQKETESEKQSESQKETESEKQGESQKETEQGNVERQNVLTSVRAYLLQKNSNPDFSSIWNVIGLQRSGMEVPEAYRKTFYQNVYTYCEQKNWILTRTKYSDYSKLIMALTSIGIDAQDVGGHNLFEYLAGGQGDSDMTGMALQALSFYYGTRTDVTAAVNRALAWISENQQESGGFATVGVETSESVAQIVVALSGLGIDADKDVRFLKNGKSPLQGLFQYYLPEGGFMHVAPGTGNNGGGAAGTLDGMATEQGFYATVSYQRMLEGKTFLYDMSDITLHTGEKQENSSDTEETDKPGNGSNSGAGSGSTIQPVYQKTKAKRITLNYKKIHLAVGQSKKLKATIYPKNTTAKSIMWFTTDKKVAVLGKNGKVIGRGAGTAVITVMTMDGSRKKASCKVIVQETRKVTPKPSGQRKTIPAATGKKAPSGQTKTLSNTKSNNSTGNGKKNSVDTKKKKNKETEAETGWSFDSADYVPDMAESVEKELESEREEAKEEVHKEIKRQVRILMPAALSGAGVLVLFEALAFGIYRKKKGRKIRGE